MNIKRRLLVLGTLVVFAGIGLYLFLKSSSNPQSAHNQTKLKIGVNNFSVPDLNTLTSTYFGQKDANQLNPTEKDELKTLALEQSTLLQEAAKNHLAAVNPSLLQTDKDWPAYNAAIAQAKQVIIGQEEQLSAEAIFLYFYNQQPPKIGVAAAKAATRAKLESLREDLVAKRITMAKAGESIRNDPSLATIDPIYQSNALASFTNRNRSNQIIGGLSATDNDLLWSLPAGSYSPVLLGYEANGATVREAYWTVVFIKDKRAGGKPYLEWLKDAEKSYEVQSF